MSILSIKIKEKIRHIKHEYETNKLIQHQGVKGTFNESDLSNLIKDIIPSRFKITKGLIENYKSEQSNETDIIIYDDDILPPYIKNDLSVIPVEALKYAFEVKSTLNSTELKTTITKYINLRKIGGNAPTVLFAFASDIKGSELTRFKENENQFFTNPTISVICVSGKGYYYKTTNEYYLKDYFSNTDWMNMTTKAINLDPNQALDLFMSLIENNDFLNSLDRAQFALAIKASTQAQNHKNNLGENEIILNGVKFSEIKFKIHKWIGLDGTASKVNNDIELSLLSGISNTLSKGNFGRYLLNEKDLDIKVFAVCFEDMWGNFSSIDYNENGLNYNTDEFSFTYSTNGDENKHKIMFNIPEATG